MKGALFGKDWIPRIQYGMIYLDHSATSYPKPDSVYRKMDQTYRLLGANPGRAGHRMSLAAAQAVEDARVQTAAFFGEKDARRLAFTHNGTDALNMAILGVLKKGDEAVTTALEHNSVLRPLRLAARKSGVRVRVVEPAGETVRPEDVAKAVTRKTRLVVVNHASNVTGWVQPVAEIGAAVRKKNPDAIYLVDASQSAGLLPVDVSDMGIDLLAFTGHKSLYGPTGTGGLIVNDRVRIKPLRVGGSGIGSESDEHPDEMPWRLEAGTENFVGIVGLAEGVRFVTENGPDKILARERELRNRMADAFRRLDGLETFCSRRTDEGIGVLSFRISGLSPSDTAGVLDQEFGICARAGLHCSPSTHRYLGTFRGGGTVRLSPGFFNTDDDAEKTAEAVRKIVRQAV